MTKEQAMIHTLAKENDELKAEIGRLRQALEQQLCEHITCKCCKYWIEEKHRKDDLGVCVCFSKAHVTCHLPKDFYCKLAERKEEE